MADVKYLDYQGLALYDQKIKNYSDTRDNENKIKSTSGRSDNGTINITPGGTTPATYYTAEDPEVINGSKNVGDIKTPASTVGTNIEVNFDNDTIIQDPTTKALKVASSALTQYIGDEDAQGNYAINVTGPDANNNKKISLDINSESNILEKTDTGLKANVQISAFDAQSVAALGSNVKEAYALVVNGTALTGTNNNQVIKIYKDSALLDIKLLHATEDAKPTYTKAGGWVDIAEQYRTEANLALCYAYENVNGTIVIESVAVGNFLRESEFKDGLQVNSGEVSVKIDSTSETFLTVSSNGIKLSGVQDAIDEASADSKTTLTEVAADQTIPVTGAPKIVVTKTVDQTDGHYNYEVSAQDMASATLLAAEVARAQSAETSIDSAIGLTKASGNETRTYSNTGNYIGQSQAGNTIKSDIAALDAALKTVEDKVDAFTPITNAEINSLFN